jgi:thiamine pyrophosphate-dependent acetolactate synthase large subunit-like protein
MKLLEEADVVIGVGASLNRHTLENGYLYPNAKYIQIDSQPHVAMALREWDITQLGNQVIR